MAIQFSHGANSQSLGSVSGSEVGELFENAILCELLALNGSETVEVYRNGTWETVDEDFVLEDGDNVRFSRVSGTKG